MSRTTTLSSLAGASCGLLVLVTTLLSTGCSGEAKAIAELKAINERVMAAGENKAVLMQMSGDRVGTMIVQGHVDEVLPHISKLGKVTEIYFAGTDFDDADVASVKGLSSLRSLVLSDTKLTNAGLADLAGMSLESLSINGTKTTAAAGESIAEMESLQILNISNTKIHEDLTPLKDLENLEWLLITDTDLSGLGDESIEALCSMPKLGRFTATGSNLKQETIDRLKAAKPALNLESGAGAEPGEHSQDGATPVPTG